MSNDQTKHNHLGLAWFKSSYSGSNGGQCHEVAITWRKSSYSGSNGGDCVEVADSPDAVHVRDSKDTSRPHLSIAPKEWAAFLDFAAQGVIPSSLTTDVYVPKRVLTEARWRLRSAL